MQVVSVVKKALSEILDMDLLTVYIQKTYAKKHLEEEADVLYDMNAVNACNKVATLTRWEIEDVIKYLKTIRDKNVHLQFDF